MNETSKEHRKLKGLLIIIIFVVPVILLSHQNPLAYSDALQIESEVSELKDSSILSYTVHSPITITANENFSALGFPGNGSIGDPYEITDFNITAAGHCISIQDTDAFFYIHDCLLTGDETDTGIELLNVSNGDIRQNIIAGNQHGIYLDESNNNSIVDNFLDGNINGFVSSTSSYNFVWANTVFSSACGLSLYLSTNNTITGNFISGGDYCGVFIHVSANNTVIYNTITGNNVGLIFTTSTSSNNLMHHNFIANNIEHSVDDDGVDNQWNTTGFGNYWSDYNGTGVYHVQGSAGSIDYFPRIATSLLAIDSPADKEYVVGYSDNNITWTPSSDYPSHYIIYRNGTEVITSRWNGSAIVTDIDGLGTNAYNYTILVNDTMGFSVVDTVFVVVLPETSLTTFNVFNAVMIIGLLSIPVIGALVVVVTHVKHRNRPESEDNS